MQTYIYRLAFTACVAAALAAGGCAGAHSKVAVVNIMTIEANWPKFQNYANQLQASFAAISFFAWPSFPSRFRRCANAART